MNVLLLTVACYGPYMAISGTIDIVQAIRRRRAGRVFVVPTALIRPTAPAPHWRAESYEARV
ncbi:MAG TPA: hypothetical protein VHA57_05270 [Actinomycetota bacterium]|nr:hypothetical protein [Actinomycetota bacterium]